MSDHWSSMPPRSLGRGAALTLVFAGVLATGAAAGSFSRTGEAAAVDSDPVPHRAGTPLRDDRAGRQGPDGAQELVSRSGDRWSAAYSAREYEGLKRSLKGEYVGVGISVRADGRAGDQPMTVERVRRGSPAERAGVRTGDRLRAVNDKKVTGAPVTEVVARLRDGAPGTSVELRLSRDGRTWESTLRRAKLRTPSVTVDRSVPGTVHLRVSSFTKGTGQRVRDAVREIPRGSGLLLDLRGNSGGLLTESVTAASALLDSGLLGTYEANGQQRSLSVDGGGDTTTPVVVLVDGGTMSAAELLAGALQDRRRAVVVGTRTFGKGTVQIPHTLEDGSVAELTVGDYATPNGRRLEGQGLLPDLLVPGGPDRTEHKGRQVLGGLAARP
ncbi:S41 family peptidase [Streptomyces sp. NPDC005438]|uniref:S41 family peptidase n=1 Tax=Streptomyces sp. NPDC005438 TaxID=3156880 RepID=UPI0033A0901C